MQTISGTTIILRLEGLALAVLCLGVFWLFHESWWLFLLLILAPDLSMLGYLGGPKLGAVLYNVVHSWVTVIVLFFIIWFPLGGDGFLLSLLAILGVHIGVDRALGFGLKHATGFKDTHLGRIGKAA